MSIPGGSNPLLLASAGGAGGGYEIERSLRFNSSDSAYCGRSFSSAGNRKTWTWSAWVKRSRTGVSNTEVLFQGGPGAGGSDSNYYLIRFDGSDRLDASSWNGAAKKLTTQVFRDLSAWYHIVFAFDSTQATAANRQRFYVNGIEVTTFTTDSAPTQNTDYGINAAVAHNIGREEYTGGTSNAHFSGYLADVHFIDGQALTPSSFTEVSATTGQLIPKQYTGSFGTNGFWLKFSDNSAATATTLGKDYSGNNNNWTPNNLVTYLGGITTGSLGGTYGGGASGSFANVLDQSTATGWGGVVNSNGQTVNVTLNFSGVSGVTSLRVFAYFRSGQSGQVSVNGGSYTGYTVGSNVGWVDATSQLSGSTTLTSLTWRMTHAIGGSETPLIYAVEVNGSIIGSASSSDIDSLVDTPTSYGTDTGAGGEVRGNYCTWNPLSAGSTTLSNGNLSSVTNNQAGACGTIQFPPSGKWFFDLTFSQAAGQVNHIGIIKSNPTVAMLATTVNTDAVLYRGDGNIFRNTGGGYSVVQTVSSYTSGDVIGVAVNNDASTVQFYKNGSTVGTAINLTTATEYTPFVHHGGQSITSGGDANFGQRQWAYAAPAGFKALCDTNLPAPVVAKPSTVMDVKLWTGNGSTQTISGLEFSPDLVWLKGRSLVSNHRLYDQIRGATKSIYSDLTDAEGTESTGLTAFTSDGFSLGSQAGHNQNASTYVGWCFDAGSNTVSNTAGSITTSVRASASSGFAVITGSTPSSTTNFSFGHNLGIAPSLVIYKHTAVSGNWHVYHRNGGGNNYNLNSTAGPANSGLWSGLDPTSTLITIPSTIISANSSAFVCYAWAPVAGYSSFGSYTGNGSTDGPFVYTGFRPRWVMIKATTRTSNWMILDTERDTYNVASKELGANRSEEENNTAQFLGDTDINSNGFKLRSGNSEVNQSAATYVWAAFAESPFQYARAR